MKSCFDVRRLRDHLLMAVFSVSSLLTSVTAHAGISVTGAWVREVPPASPVAAAYLTLRNDGNKPVRLLRVESPLADKVHWHDMRHDGGVMRMKVRTRVVLPAGERVELSPGGSHLMLLGLKRPLVVGTKVPLLLRFDNRESLRVEAEVRRIEVEAASRAGHAHHH